MYSSCGSLLSFDFLDNNKLALIIAGTSEVGQGLIEKLIMDGFSVVFTWNSNRSACELIKTNYGDKVSAIKLDLTSENSVREFCCLVSDIEFEVAIYCAGYNPAKLCSDLEFSMLRDTTSLNFLSGVAIFNAVVMKMKQNKLKDSKLVFISSVASQRTSVGNSIYGATKQAMERYLSTLALEEARFNIRTICISPGYIKTKMLDEYCQSRGENISSIIKNIPMRKILNVDDVVKCIMAFLGGLITTTGTSLIIGNGEGIR
ncbi:SDR family NAD(P)-dependent oxidoreductase [Vibrio spartinae]|uniref:3-oxoacyl-[acyl-carrier-protein] reductase FabG n=1 Tax=Vibrio spartinae TaxID=1918945 RepID=A0A1N6M5P5_9VIBR|nr:SDR family oxidoreductase [Vibrio spartinae]SIO94752.1 3-oxoacyl-[acyl-carrier-protein] reductase FabG [Vibrio spartinae]